MVTEKAAAAAATTVAQEAAAAVAAAARAVAVVAAEMIVAAAAETAAVAAEKAAVAMPGAAGGQLGRWVAWYGCAETDCRTACGEDYSRCIRCSAQSSMSQRARMPEDSPRCSAC